MDKRRLSPAAVEEWRVDYGEDDGAPAGSDNAAPTLHVATDVRRVNDYVGRVWSPTRPTGRHTQRTATCSAPTRSSSPSPVPCPGASKCPLASSSLSERPSTAEASSPRPHVPSSQVTSSQHCHCHCHYGHVALAQLTLPSTRSVSPSVLSLQATVT